MHVNTVYTSINEKSLTKEIFYLKYLNMILKALEAKRQTK